MAATDYGFTEEDMVVNETLGYPKAFVKLAKSRNVGPYSLGPPFTFTPYSLQQDEALHAEELELMFPIIDPEAKPTAKLKIFVSLLWKQLNHLGNAGFDPSVIRVDPYGNVLYFHADSASPLAWNIDHWFPCSRGGLTVPSNLRILQWQACNRKHNKLEFLIPWWDFQLGISVNQFLSIFASSNSDFRHRAFSFLFAEAENEEINPEQSVDSHSFPYHFIESMEKSGLAPAAIVVSKRESRDNASVLRSLDFNRQQAAKKEKLLKENADPNHGSSTYQAIVMARDSLKHKEEATKMKSELLELDSEVSQLKRKNEDDKLAIQDLELTLIKRRRRAEKCRRLAESQSSYRTMLEKMIRDAMHQSVIYKEQVRLNQAAANALMARLEAQKAICDSSEKDLHKIHKQKQEIEREIKPEWDQMRKRTRIDEDLLIDEQRDRKSALYLPSNRESGAEHRECPKPRFPVGPSPDNVPEEVRECRTQRGKQNVEKWLQILLEDSPDDVLETSDEVVKNLNLKYPHKEEEFVGKHETLDEVVGKHETLDEVVGKHETLDEVVGKGETVETVEAEPPKMSFEKKGKGKGLVRSESARILRRIPSSPSILLKKGVDFIRKKKPVVFSDDENDQGRGNSNRFFRSPFKMSKKTAKIV